MANLSAAVTEILTDWLPATVTALTSNSVLLIGVSVYIVGFCVSLIKKMMRAH